MSDSDTGQAQLFSEDRRWWWNGADWIPAPGIPESTGSPASSENLAAVSQPAVIAQHRRDPYPARTLIRVLGEGSLAALVVGLLVYNAGSAYQQTKGALDAQLTAQKAQVVSLQGQVADLQAEVQDLKERWYGSPAIFQPAPIGGAVFRFFDISGATQHDLIDSLNRADICQTYGPCLKDPLNPGGVAWALEWSEPAVSYYYCYAPATTTVPYRQVILLPRWSPALDGSVKIPLVEKWNALMQVFYTHEAGHAAIDRQDIAELNAQAQGLRTCQAVVAFWKNPAIWNKDGADQLAYHARLYADCRPEIGCIPAGWMGW
jgi:hypothetical protein